MNIKMLFFSLLLLIACGEKKEEPMACGEVTLSPVIVEKLSCIDGVLAFEATVSQGLTCTDCCSDYSFVADVEVIDNVVSGNSSNSIGVIQTCEQNSMSFSGGSFCEFGIGSRTIRMYNVRDIQYSNPTCNIAETPTELTATVTITQADLDNCCN